MWWRRLLALVAVFAIPAALLAVRMAPPAVTTRMDDDEARRLVVAAEAARRDGFAAPATADPASWYDSACPCLAADRQQLQVLARAGHALVGPGPQVISVRVAALLGEEVVLDVVDRLPPYLEVDASGRVLRRWAGREDRRWRVVLVRGKITNWRPA